MGSGDPSSTKGADSEGDAGKVAQGVLGAGSASLKTLTDALDAIKAALTKLAPQDADVGADGGSNPAETTPPKVETGLPNMAALAVERYRRTMRWMLGAFSTVGLVVFGSVPFANLGDTSTGGDWAWIIAGLSGVALGVAGAVYSVSLVAEPEDASLGELSADFKPFKQPTPDVTFWKPRKRARWVLYKLLTGGDGHNHLGPRWYGSGWEPGDQPRVENLIDAIGSGQRARYPAAAQTAKAQRRKQAAKTVLDQATASTKALWDRWFAIVDKASNGAPAMATKLQGEFTDAWAAEKTAALGYQDMVRDEGDRLGELAGLDARLDVHLQHREIVIDESGVTQLRGTFRLARRILLLSVFAIAFGAVAYASRLPLKDDESKAKAANASTSLESPTYRSQAEAGGGVPVTVLLTRAPAGPASACVGKTLTGVTVGDYDPKATGPVTVAVVSPQPCVGTWTLDRGDDATVQPISK